MTDIIKRKRNRRSWGWVELDKTTSPQTWKGRWADWSKPRLDKTGRARPAQRSVVLGYKTKDDLPTKSKAQEKWDDIREGVMRPAPAVEVKQEWTFADFVWKRYVPDRSQLRGWRPATKEKFEFLMVRMSGAFGARRLTDITTGEMQTLLVDLAKRECADTVKGVRSYLRAIFREAHEQKLIEYNPASKLVVPKTRKPSRPVLTTEQIQALEARLSGKDRVIFNLYTRCGLRAAEPFGLETDDVLEDDSIFVHQTYSRYGLGETKTEGSAKKVAVPVSLHPALLELQAASRAAGVRWLFPASRARHGVLHPLSPENWLKRVLKPVADELGIAVDLRMFRRGFATVAGNQGGNLKDIQHQMRHASATTTANVYMQAVPESVRKLVNQVDEVYRRGNQTEESPDAALTTPLRHLDLEEEIAVGDSKHWWAVTGSNCGPPACKAGALTG